MGQYDNYIDYWKQHIHDNDQSEETLRELKRLAKKCAKILVEKYGAKRVYLIGSVAREMGVHEDSDIDLVVEGLANEHYLKAFGELCFDVLNGVELNLIPLEDAFETIKQELREEGVYLYGKE